MAYPSTTTIDNFNIENKDTSLVFTEYTSLTLVYANIIGVREATENIQHNIVDGSLASLAPYSRGATLPKDPVNTTVVTEPFQRIGDAVVNDFANVENARGVSQLGQQGRSVEARILREVDDQFINGNGTPPNLTGIDGRADATIDASSAALTLAMLYQLRYSVNPASEEGLGWGANAFICHPDTIQKVMALLGTDIGAMQWVYRQDLNVSVPNFLGCDVIADQNVSTSKIYALNWDHVYIYYAENDQYPANKFGVVYTSIPMQGDVSELGVNISWTGAFRNDPGAIARLINFT